MGHTEYLGQRVGNPIFLNVLSEIAQNKKVDHTLVLFGAGLWGREYLEFAKKYFEEILFCDNNSDKWGTTIEGVPVISFDQLKNVFTNSYITITSLDYYDSILEQLIGNHMKDRLLPPLSGIVDEGFNDYTQIIDSNQSEFDQTFDLLADDLSKQVFIQRINLLLTGDIKNLFSLRSKSPQYFEEEIIHLTSEEIFVDGGAYTGDTVEEFLRNTDGKFRGIYSFEPETTKHPAFSEKFSNHDNIHLFPSGLWNEEKLLKFDSLDNGSSAINQTGNSEVKVVSLDRVLSDEPVTFIKMDIEGAELMALEGARETIKKYKPKLAICIYHKPLDIVQIPLLIKKLVPEYKIYLRHYNINTYETVCYAVID
ncbi:hypothetical protein A8L34_24970 [Bacillus sp. FJAT-27264]|uniref:FkbM family methyltransferase n=1 Tax=Paenibacillus sp. (strain DSM 101736 / FJAT-27264) TaxID=1850362 RepID=UPI0008081841|nr:FkbM family methyltransferase [Bacillus sp. FJAT-27264]OBZ07885.1 hypothetical protein A8L34_24970 [Bacillus sp. FJAT-27264]